LSLNQYQDKHYADKHFPLESTQVLK